MTISIGSFTSKVPSRPCVQGNGKLSVGPCTPAPSSFTIFQRTSAKKPMLPPNTLMSSPDSNKSSLTPTPQTSAGGPAGNLEIASKSNRKAGDYGACVLNRSGAGGENRTRVISLEGWSNTIIRHPRGHNSNNLDWFVKPRETLWWDPLGNKTHGVLVTLPNATGHLMAQQKLPLRREYATTLGIFIASGYVEGR